MMPRRFCSWRNREPPAKDGKDKRTVELTHRPIVFKDRKWLGDSGADGFGLCVEIEGVVSHLASPTRLFVTSKGHARVEDVVAVDPHRAGAKLLRHAMRLANVPRPDGSGQAVVAVVGPGNDFFRIRKWHRRHDRSEDFFLHDFHVFLGVYQDRRFNEVSTVTGLVAASHSFCAFGESGL